MRLTKKLFIWINQQCNINELKYIGNNSTYNEMSFLIHLTIEKPILFKHIIYHIILSYKKYNLDLLTNQNCFLRFLFWNYEDQQNVINLRLKILKSLKLEFFNLHFYYFLNYKKPTSILECFFEFCNEKEVQYILDKRKDVIKNTSFMLKSLLNNDKLSLSFKKKAMHKLIRINKITTKESVYCALLVQNPTIKEAQSFIDFCNKNLSYIKPFDRFTLNHVICLNAYSELNHITEMILNLNLPHEANAYGFFPLHKLINSEKENEDDKTIKMICQMIQKLRSKKIDFNSQTPKGNTPLHIAVFLHKKNFTIIKELILSDSKLNIKNKYGKTPYDYIQKFINIYTEEEKEFINSYYEKELLEEKIMNDNKIEMKKIKI